MASKHKRSDAGNSIMPKRILKVLPLTEKEKVLDFIRKGKKTIMPKRILKVLPLSERRKFLTS